MFNLIYEQRTDRLYRKEFIQKGKLEISGIK